MRILKGIFFGSVLLLGSSWAQAAVQFAYSDHLGSAALVTNEAGEAQQIECYFPFGEVLTPHLSSSPQRGEERGEGVTAYLYTGQELDRASELYYYGARYYDPALARFTSIDPVFDSPSPYAYVVNNPIKYFDPFGEEPKSYQNLFGAFIDQYEGNRPWGEEFKIPTLFGDKSIKWASWPSDIRLDKEGTIHLTLHPVDPETGEEFLTSTHAGKIEHRNTLEIQLHPFKTERMSQREPAIDNTMKTLANAYQLFKGFNAALEEGVMLIRFEFESGESTEFNLRTGVFQPDKINLTDKRVTRIEFVLNQMDPSLEEENIFSQTMYLQELGSTPPLVSDLFYAFGKQN